MAKDFSDTTRKSILLMAFTRGLRDGFHHARIAALIALNATSEYYEPEVIALRIVPAISYVILDKEKSARIQAFKAIASFITRLEQVAEEMSDTALVTPTAITKDNFSQHTDPTTNSNTFTPGISMFGGATKGLAEWAISSVNRFGTPSGEIEPQNTIIPGSDPAETAPITPSDHLVPEESTLSDGWQSDGITTGLNDGWEPFDSGPHQLVTAEPISSIIRSSNNHMSSVSSFASPPVLPSASRIGPAHSSMKLTLHTPSLADTLQLDDDYTPPLTPTTPIKYPTNSTVLMSNTDRKAKLEQKRNERRQRMAELWEKKKSGIGAKKTSVA